MKEALLIILITTVTLYTVAQNTYVPDDNFEKVLIDLGYDDVLDDYVLTVNISGLTYLNVISKNISDLTGIEDFISLTVLYCNNNQITDLDFSNNTNLSDLECRNNELTTLNLSQNSNLTDLNCGINELTELDISQSSGLLLLSCDYNDLTELDLSQNSLLLSLECNHNNLAALSLLQNSNLTNLDCGSNELTGLDISNLTGLINLDCYTNLLSELDLTQNTVLHELNCGHNQLTTIDLTQNPALSVADLVRNQLTSLDLSQNTNLTYLQCQDNALTALDLTQNTLLTFVWCQGNGIAELDLSQNTLLEEIACGFNEITELDFTLNPNLITLYCYYLNQLSFFDIRNGNNDQITTFYASSNPNLTCLYVDDSDATYLSDWDIDENTTFVETEADCDALDIESSLKETCNIIYPNPSNGVVYINFPEEKYIEKLIISDITGKQILEKTNVQQNTAMLHTLDLSDFKTGIYIIEIQTEKEFYTSKIIKR